MKAVDSRVRVDSKRVIMSRKENTQEQEFRTQWHDFSSQETPKDDDRQNAMSTLRLSEGIEQYKYASKVEGKATKTLEQYDYVFEKFTNFLEGDPPVEEITPNKIRSFIKSLMDDNYSKSTVSINYRVLRAFFNWLVDESLLDSSPLDNIKEPKTPNKYPRVLNKDQVERLIEAARKKKDTWSGYRNYTIILCFIDMGLRLKELINAKLTDLDFKERTLQVEGKGAKERQVYFGIRTYKKLKKWVRIREDLGEVFADTIFISERGEELEDRNLQRRITNIQKEAGLEHVKVSPHVLRHTAASLAVQNGMETFALKRFFGWESIKTAMRYVHMNNKVVQEAFQKASPIDNLPD